MRDKTTDERIRDAGWFKGSERQWQALTHEQRQDLAFAGCGCEAAYATWEGPVDCVHPGCQIRRGEKPKIHLTNCILKGEMYNGWLRFDKETTEGRLHLARLIRGIRRNAVKTGIYDPWKMEGGWQAMVASAITV
jgi:hypothetical protein